jgi:hypothetical protein
MLLECEYTSIFFAVHSITFFARFTALDQEKSSETPR